MPNINQISYVESLIRNSTYDHETQAKFEKDILNMNNSELEQLASNLRDNQLDAIHENGRYSQTDLKQ